MKKVWVRIAVFVVIIVPLVTVLIIGFFFHVERHFSIVLRGDWKVDDVHHPHGPWPGRYLVGTSAIPFKYTRTRKAYAIQVLVNPANHGFSTILQIHAVNPEGSRLPLVADWPGRCGSIDKVTRLRPGGWQAFFKNPDAIGFFWATEIYCAQQYPRLEQKVAMAREASRVPIKLGVKDKEGATRIGNEEIKFVIEPNGWLLALSSP